MTNRTGYARPTDWLTPAWLKATDMVALAHAGGVTGPQPQAAPAVTTVYDFEDLGAQGDYGTVPADYTPGLTWTGFAYVTASYLAEDPPATDNGFYRGVTSGDTVVYSAGTLVTIASGGANFALSSLALTAGYNDNLRVLIEGYDDGELIYSRVVRVDNDGPRLLNLNFRDIDQVLIASSGGQNDSPDGKGRFFVLDDVAITTKAGTVSGTVFDDLDGDGVQDRGENGIRGRTVFLDTNHNGLLDEGELSARTRADGSYKITGVPFGDYDIVETVPKGWHATYPFVEGDGYTSAEVRNRFIEIAGSGNTQVFNEADDGFSFLEASRGFTFYGQTYIDIYISTNGYIAFGSQPEKGFSNQDMPNGTSPNAVIAPLWDDYILGDTGKVYAIDDELNGRIIIEWKNVQRYGDQSGAKYTFEAILSDDGSIRFAYKDVPPGGTATIGVENESGTIATQVSYNEVVDASTGYLFEPYSIQFGKTTIRVDSGDVLTGVDFGQTRNVMTAAFAADAHADHHGGGKALLLDHAVAQSHDMTVHLV